MESNNDDLMYGGDGEVMEDTFDDEIDDNRPFADGEVMIKNKKYKNYALDMSESGIIHCNKYNTGDNQTWLLDYDSDKEGYKIKSKQNPELLLSWSKDAKQIILKGCTETGSKNQYWRFEMTEHKYIIRNLENVDLVITMQDKSSSLGGKGVTVCTENTASDIENQNWTVALVYHQPITDGDYNVINRNLPDIVVEYRNEQDSLVYAKTYLCNENQEWQFAYDAEKEAYIIKSVLNPKLLLTWNSNDASKEIVLRGSTGSGSKNQYWRTERTEDGSFKLRNLGNLSKILTLSKQTDAQSGFNLTVHDDSDNKDLYPIWTIDRVSHQTISDADYHIINRTLPDITMGLISQGDSLVNGNKYAGNVNHKWTITYDIDRKAYKIKCGASSDLLLSWNSNAATKERCLRALPESGSKNQYWRIEQTKDGSYKLRNLENTALLAVIEKDSAQGGKELVLSDTSDDTWNLYNNRKGNIPDGKFKIATKLSCQRVIDTNEASVLVITDNANLVSSEWLMSFDSSANAYKIIWSKDRKLGWVYQDTDCSVKLGDIADSGNLRNYWTVEYNLQKGSYLIRSLNEPLHAVSYSDDNSVITSTASYFDNQLFHFIRN